MSEQKHTPGPWGQWISRRSATRGNPRSVIRTYKGGALVCVIESGASEADRALIAAAPELLEALIACEAALRLVERETGNSYAATSHAKAAIAKAEDKQ